MEVASLLIAWRNHFVKYLNYKTLGYFSIGSLIPKALDSPSLDHPHVFSAVLEPSTRLIHLAGTQDMMAVEIRGRDNLLHSWGCVTSRHTKLGRFRIQDIAKEVLGMDETIPSVILRPPLMQCLRCKKPITTFGGTGRTRALKMPFANEACQDMNLGGSIMVQQSLHDHCKDETLGLGKNWHNHVGENSGNKGSAPSLGFDKLPDEVQTYLKEMEIQVHKIRGENSELKRAISHLYNLVQVTNTEVRNNSSKINWQVAKLAENLDKGCPCSINLDSKIMALHSSLRIVEAKIDGMRADIRKSIMDIHGGAGGMAGGRS